MRSLKIIPHSPFSGSLQDLFLQTIEKRVLEILPPHIKSQILKFNSSELMNLLPIFKFSTPEDSKDQFSTFWVSFLCPGQYMHGVSRYVDDALCRWLIPGKNLMIAGAARLKFSFANLPNIPFFFGSSLIEIESNDDMEIIYRNLSSLIEEMRLNILAVLKARHIASLKSISLERKHQMIQENLNKILNLNPFESNHSLFDQMHNFLMKLSEEEKMGQIQKTIAYLTQARPKAFDREMFSEMTYFTVLFKEQFASRRDPRHISRVIALHYLFKKVLLDSVEKSPNKRHISLKVYKTKMNPGHPVLGILLGISIIRESERFEKTFLLDAIRACIPGVEAVKDSYLFDRREKKVFLFYIEVFKPSFASFDFTEINHLRQRLDREVKKQIESDVHPIFLPRNEEEMARNLILLSQQLKYARDLPQVSIHYEKQSDSELYFSIIIVRLVTKKTLGFREQILSAHSDLKFSIEEIREIGKLRKKIPKETAILSVSLDKIPFFRPDYSVDLLRARGKVAYELVKVIGEYRDFNGGMILKQEEALIGLRKQIGSVSQETEFLLEEYFYSLRPGIMQTVLPPEVLKSHFDLLLKIKKMPFVDIFPKLEEKINKFFLIFFKSKDSSFKERLDIAVERLKIPSYELTNCFIQMPSYSVAGYILRTDEDAEIQNLKNAIEEAIGTCEIGDYPKNGSC